MDDAAAVSVSVCCAKEVMGFKHTSDTERKRMWDFSTDVVCELAKSFSSAKLATS